MSKEVLFKLRKTDLFKNLLFIFYTLRYYVVLS